ncbi:MAG: hypothetical protein JXR96_25005 [Deltaproteobacteria bacterium]|nr:hypothetical protein [Deltaproteobacteria bacterium]
MRDRGSWCAFVTIAAFTAGACGGGDTCTPGTKGCTCRNGDECDPGLVCTANRCEENGPEPGTEGGPCYTDHTCDPGLECSDGDRCQRPADTDGGTDAADGGGDASDGDMPDGATDGGEDGGADGEPVCDPIPGWPPDEQTAPWYSGRQCLLPECDEGVENDCRDASGTWTQRLTTISHTCPAWMENFDERLEIGNTTVVEHLVFNTIGECDYDEDFNLVGVVKGATGISCQVTTEDDGLGGTITVVQTGVATLAGDTMTGTARVFLFDLPMGTADCSADYDLEFVRE